MPIIFKKSRLTTKEYNAILARTKQPGKIIATAQPKKESKYKNESCSCVAGHVHMSRGEARYCETLYYLKKAGEIIDYKIQKKFALVVNGELICNHYVDFLVTCKDGKIQAEEYKGFETDVWRMKRKLFEAIYDIPYIVINTKGYKLRKKR